MNLYLIVAAFGAVIGSFLNVCIYRLPREESVAWPASHCPACRQAIAFYDNIPILSYLILWGRCRFCQAPISIQYPLVEAANAVGYVLVFWMFGFTAAACAYAVLVSALIVATGTDLSHTMIPDAVTLPGIVIGLLCITGWSVILARRLHSPDRSDRFPAWRSVGWRYSLVFGLDQSLCFREGGYGGRGYQAHGYGRCVRGLATGVVGHYDRILSGLHCRCRAYSCRGHAT